MERPSFTIGIEEEYLIVDRETRDLVRAPDKAFLQDLSDAMGEQVTGEYLQCQVEVGTRAHGTVAAAAEDLAGLRRAVSRAAAAHGYAPIAASTHPFAKWREQLHTPKPRYDALHDDLGLTVRRMLICGCHVHIGIEDPELRIDLMNQVAYFLPHLLALSCSSPFWEGEDTKLASYRLTVFDALPRTGLPDTMSSFAEYRRMVDHMVAAGCIEDATKIWWDIRPSDKYPTIEQRVTDVCSRLEDVVTIAALYQSLLAYLFRLRARNQRWRLYPATLVGENRWRAQRYGAEGQLVDHGRAVLAPVADLIEELIDLLGTDAEALGCQRELMHARRIAAEGTSATRQRARLAAAVDGGASRDEALRAVVDGLIAEFTDGLNSFCPEGAVKARSDRLSAGSS
ncbi:MAG: carboxylate-amine ligase [Pseudomonadota bacterium]